MPSLMRIQHSVGFQKGQVPMAHLMHKYKTQNTLSVKQTVITAAAPPRDQHRCISKNRRKHSQLLRARTFSFISFSSLLLQRCFEGLKSRTPQLNLSHIWDAVQKGTESLRLPNSDGCESTQYVLRLDLLDHILKWSTSHGVTFFLLRFFKRGGSHVK